VAKKEGGASHGDVKWLLSLSDFFLQLVILFLLLFVVSNIDRGKIEAIVRGLQEKKGLPVSKLPLTKSKTKGDFLALIAEKLATTKKGYLKEFPAPQRNIKVSYEAVKNGVLIRLENLEMFNTGSAQLLEQAKTILIEFAKELTTFYNIIEIIGYTSSLYEDSYEGDHITLAFERAKSVYNLFKEKVAGFSPAQYKVVSAGNTSLLTNVPDPITQKINQRVEFLITTELLETK
jgi:chemotaxis protein MotB